MTQKMALNPAKIVALNNTGFIGNALSRHVSSCENVSLLGFNSSSLDLTSPDSVGKLTSVLNEETILVITARVHSNADSYETLLANLRLLTNLARFLESRPIRKCIYFSSTSVYGDELTNLSITEETPFAASTCYGISKVFGEFILTQAAAKQKTPLVILRPCMVYGPGDSGEAYGPTQFIQSILKENKVFIFGDGSESRDYIFIDDLVDIVMKLALGNQSGVFNISSGQHVSFQQIVSYLKKLVNASFEVHERKRSRATGSQKLVFKKLLSEISGFRFTGFEEGLTRTFQYFSTELPKTCC